jgi:malonyl-CoA decarboxylase
MREEHDLLPNMGLSNLRRRTVVSVLRAWREVEEIARHAISHDIRPSVPKEDIELLRTHMKLCLDNRGGEVTARARTADLGRTYLKLNEAGRAKFLRLLAGDFAPDDEILNKLSKEYIKVKDGDNKEKLRLEIAMRNALITPRSVILRQFTALPDGFKFLINMREDLLPVVGDDVSLKGLEYDLKSILFAWFDIGLLDMQEITWKSPAALLEKLIEYEAVHSVASWDDLKNRLDSDRRVFAFFHNKMPLEPLIFVHVALVNGMSDNIQQLLDEKSPVIEREKADTAIFYSISNAQKGLVGISFGNFLIKRVVGVLTSEMKNIKNFSTLSPIPTFRNWLELQLANSDNELVNGNEKELLATLDTQWHKDKKLSALLKPVLLRLCTHYLLNEKKNDKPADPVCNFHLSNGARLERLNWLADTSAKGLKQSAGMMANYYYKLSEIDENHEEFMAHGKIVSSKNIRNLL